MNAQLKLNPYATPAVAEPSKQSYAIPIIRWRKRTIFAVSLTLLGAIVAAGISAIEIESILVSGPLMAFMAIVLSVLGLRRPWKRLLFIAVPLLIFVLSVFIVINYKQWGPSEARQPVSVACIVFALLMQSGWLTLIGLSKPASAMQDEAFNDEPNKTAKPYEPAALPENLSDHHSPLGHHSPHG